MSPTAPRVSVGIPVRNGERFVRRAIESVLAQDLEDLEVVVSDNASTDDTPSIVAEIARRDPRVRSHRNERDIGQIENFNHVFRLARGEYFRWMGADDQLDPGYASACVEALVRHREAVGCTTACRFRDDDGHEDARAFAPPRLDAPSPLGRLRQALQLLRGPKQRFDPIYSMLRRSALLQTGLLPINRWPDRVLALELCLAGPFCHVDAHLSTRREAREHIARRVTRFHPTLENGRHPRTKWAMYMTLGRAVSRHFSDLPARATCWSVVLAAWAAAEMRPVTRRAAGLVRGKEASRAAPPRGS